MSALCTCLNNTAARLHLRDRRVQTGVAATILLTGVVWAKYFRNTTTPQPLALQITSYNTLAPTMAASDWYGHIDPSIMNWSQRQTALLDRISSLNSDLVCLQEVEPEFFQSLLDPLRKQGYIGRYVRKLQDHPDGLALFYKPTSIQFTDYDIIYFKKSSFTAKNWRPAQILTFEYHNKKIGLVNTHLAWDQAGKLAHEQLNQLLQEEIKRRSLDGWLLCGDFNVTPQQSAIQLLHDHGFQYAYEGAEQMTCSIKHFTGKVDYIQYTSDSLQATADRIYDLAQGTPLPTLTEPSDHLPITAHITLCPE